MNTLQITVDGTGTRVTFHYCGHITASLMQEHVAETEALAGKVKPGFQIFTDLSGLERIDPECVPILGRVMDRLNDFGVGSVIRLIPDPKKDIGLGILTLFHYRSGVHINTVATRADADRLLT